MAYKLLSYLVVLKKATRFHSSSLQRHVRMITTHLSEVVLRGTCKYITLALLTLVR